MPKRTRLLQSVSAILGAGTIVVGCAGGATPRSSSNSSTEAGTNGSSVAGAASVLGTSSGGSAGAGTSSTGASSGGGSTTTGSGGSGGLACATGSSSCGSQCRELSSDAANCGACGTACAAAQVCSLGKCGSACAPGLTKCGSACVDLTGSAPNCGTCGNACPADQSCWMSACRCATGQGACGTNDACVDVLSSTTNCGTCGNACASGGTCDNGVCACPTGLTACAGKCVDLTSDNKNCNACGSTCSGSTSCLYGACIDPTSLSCAGTKANNSCTQDASITLGKYWVNNNEWGAASGSGTQCIWSNCQTGDLVGWGTSFNWTGTANAVKTYASLVFGWQWGWKVQNTGLPLQLSSPKAVNCGWDFTVTQTGTITIDVSYDMFAHAISNPGATDNPTDEIMVWLYRANGAGPIGATAATVTIDGTSWELHKGTNNSWNVYSYVRTANAETAALNMMDFMADLVSRGWMTKDKYLSSVQAGTEVFTGNGQLQTNGFYCRVQ
jgi:xyloglucan-specific endo-beta-1,4-glucanase